MLLFSIMIIGFLHPYSDLSPPCQLCFLLLPMWFKIGYCIFSFLSCLPFPPSFLIYFPFPLCSLPHFVLFHKSYVFLHSTEDSKSFLESSRRTPPENYRCCFLPISLSWLALYFSPPLLFTLTHSRKIWPVLVSFHRQDVWVSIHHLLRSLSGGQVSMPSFWQIPPNTFEVDQSPLDSLKHLKIYIYK